MSDTTTEKPVYKTGSNLQDIFEDNTAPPSIETPAETPSATIDTPIATTVEVETPAVATPEATTTPTVEENVASFNLGEFDTPEQPVVEQPTTPQATAPQQTDWRELIKAVDKKELLKAAGLDDFDIELHEYRAKGGDPVDYLGAKAIDWNKVSDEDVVKEDMKRSFPNLTTQEINRLYNKKYGYDETATEDEIFDAQLLLKTEAYQKRQQKIAEQANFKIPAPIQQKVETTIDEQAQKEAVLEQQRQVEATIRYFAEHDATKSLMTSKRVALNLGDNGTFNFNVERPELIMKAITDGSVWQKLTSNKQGEPDVAKMQRIALYAFNPEQFETSLVNYGKTLGLKQVVEDGQNITKGVVRTLPAHNANETEKDAWRRAKSSTLGG